MGMPLLSIDGKLITRTKKWVLECFSCEKLVFELDKEFCPSCGNHSLLRVSCSVNENGVIILYRKQGFKVNTRGMQYDRPLPKGGRKGDGMIFHEDEMMMGSKYYQYKKWKKQQEKKFDSAWNNLGEAGADLDSRGATMKKPFVYGFGRKNPNDSAVHKYKKKGKK